MATSIKERLHKGYAEGGYVGSLPNWMRNPRAANDNSTTAGNPVRVTVNNNAPGTQATAQTDAQGHTTISVDQVVDQVTKKQAQNVGRGRGPLAAPLSRNVPRIG